MMIQGYEFVLCYILCQSLEEEKISCGVLLVWGWRPDGGKRVTMDGEW